jgi:hypothetical protein
MKVVFGLLAATLAVSCSAPYEGEVWNAQVRVVYDHGSHRLQRCIRVDSQGTAPAAGTEGWPDGKWMCSEWEKGSETAEFPIAKAYAAMRLRQILEPDEVSK